MRFKALLKKYLHIKVLIMLIYGISAGLPYMLIFSTLSLWLQQAGVDRSAITYFSWAALGYSFKFIWAPLVDHLPLPLIGSMGRRRSWLLLTQILLILSIAAMALIDPAIHLNWMAALAILLGFSAASQDLAIDAYRIECASADMQALLASVYVVGYRLGMVLTGAGALLLAAALGANQHSYHYSAWRNTYLIMAALPLLGVFTTLFIAEPAKRAHLKAQFSNQDYLRFLCLFAISAMVFALSFYVLGTWFDSWQQAMLASQHFSLGSEKLIGALLGLARLILALSAAFLGAQIGLFLRVAKRDLTRAAYIAPIQDFFRRYGRKVALLIFAFIGLYRISDIVMGAIANVFYQDIGYSLIAIGTASKTYGLLMTIAGGFIGGILSLRFGLIKLLFAGALLSALSNLLFTWLAYNATATAAPPIWQLYFVISADNLAAGIAQAAFIAFLSALTNIQFTASQYAIFSSMMTFAPKLLAGYSGGMSQSLGYGPFFMMTAILGVPVLFLIVLLAKHVKLGQTAKSK